MPAFRPVVSSPLLSDTLHDESLQLVFAPISAATQTLPARRRGCRLVQTTASGLRLRIYRASRPDL